MRDVWKYELAGHVGEILKAERNRHGLTVRDVAYAASLSPGTVSRIENGYAATGSVGMMAVADVLDLTLPVLLRRAAHRIDQQEETTNP